MRRTNGHRSKVFYGLCALALGACRGTAPPETTTVGAELTTAEENDLITTAWNQLGGAATVGNATGVATDLPNVVGRYQQFANGVIVWSNDNGAVLVPTAIFNFWIGLVAQPAAEDPTRTQFDYLGLPKTTSDSPPDTDTVAWDSKTNFTGGIIGVTGGQVRSVQGNIFARYAANPAKWGFPTGAPAHTNIPNLQFAWIGEAFTGGEIWTRGTPATNFTTVELQAGPTFNFWTSTSLYGDPMSNITPDGHGGDFGIFTGGNIYSSPSTGAFGIPANPNDGNGHSLLSEYTGLGGPQSWLGYPTAASGTSAGGAVYSSFQNGLLVMYPLSSGGFAAPQPFGTLTFSWDSAQDTDSPGCFGVTVPFTSICLGSAEGPFMQSGATVFATGSSTPLAGPVFFPPSGSGCSESFVGFTLSSQSNVFCDGSQQTIGFTVPLGVAQGTSSFTVDFVSQGFSDSLFSGSSPPTEGHLQRVYNIDNQWGTLENHQETAPDNGSYNFTSHVVNTIPFDNTDFKGALWWSFSNFDTAELPYSTYADTFAGVAAESFNGVGSWGDKLYYDLAYKGSAANGNCFGMALDSVDAEFGRRSTFDEPIHQFFGGSISTQDGRALDATANAAYAGLAQEINVKFGYQLGVDMINYALLNFVGATASPQSTLSGVQGALASNDHPLFTISSDFFLKNGHVIRPYQMGPSGVPCQTITGSTTCTQVFVLDPNIPSALSSDIQFVEFSSDDRWAYDPMVGGKEFYSAGEYAGGSFSGGRIMYVPYSVLDHQSATPVAEIGAVLAVASIFIFSDSAGLTQVTDDSGRTLFNPGIVGVPSHWEDLATGATAIPNMAPIPLADPAPSAPAVFATKGLKTTQVVSVGLATGQPSGTSYEAAFLSGLLSTDLVAPGTAGVPDQITLTKLGTPSKSVGFTVPAGGTAKPISWTFTGPDKRRPIVLSQLMVKPAQQLTTFLENGAGRIKIDNNGPATSATISLGNTTSDPVSAGTFPIPTGESGEDCSFTGATPVCVPMSLEFGSIFGFENPTAWTGQGFPLATVSAPRTEGSFALQVGSSGFREIFSAVFNTDILQGITSKLALDVYLPVGPSNPFWLGAVQLYANCPSANIYHSYQGEIELTGKPSGAFSTVTFNLTPQVVAAMKGQHGDFSLSIAVNAAPAAQSFVLDNLHFTQ
jgi:hypothetical protein